VTRVLLALVVLAGTAHAERERRAYVGRALAAVRDLGEAGRTKLDRELYAAARTRCRIDEATPAPSCMLDAVRSVCGTDASCLAAADVIAVNLRGTNELLDETARMRILNKSKDYRTDLTAELAKRYAVLAAELVLERNGADDAAAIDRLCTQRDREIRTCEPGAAACMPSVPWSRCVAMLVWFVGGNSR
jgi:hypothetical protein